ALEHARDRPSRSKPDQPGSPELVRPLGVEEDLGAIGIENLEDLILVGLRVVQDLLARKRRARFFLSARVPHHAPKIADQELNVMTQILKLPQLIDDHGVTEVEIRRGWVHPELDPQMAAGFELLPQLRLNDQLVASTLDQFQLVVNIAHERSGMAWP